MPKLFKNDYFVGFILLLAVLILAFGNIIFLGKTLTSSALPVGTTRTGPYLYKGQKPLLPIADGAASAWHWEPAMQLNNQAYKNGELPLWNPYNGAGQPLAADMQSASFHLPALPVILSPTPAVWDFFLLLRLLMAGFFTFMFLRLIKIRVAGSIAGAVTFMLSGYLMFYVNMAHLNVEILIPLMLFSVEFLHQRKNFFAVSLLAISSALVVTGGMPESALLNFGFAFAYFLYRTSQEYREKGGGRELAKLSSLFSLGLIAGALISVAAWAPFLEYVNIFWSNHSGTKAVLSIHPNKISQLLAPMFLGVQGVAYLGVIPLFLSLFVEKKHAQKWFFAIAALIVGIKVFGLGLNWLGYLPIISKIFFFKYGQALLAMSIAALTAMAVDSGLKTRLSAVIPFSILWAGGIYFLTKNLETFYNVKRLRLDYYADTNAKWALVFLATAILIVLIPKIFKKINLKYFSAAVVVLIFLELWFHIPSLRTTRHDPYIAPPFVKYLQKQNGQFRTYGVNAILWPNTNAPYGIQDIRSLNAVQPVAYMDYLSLFSDLRKKGHVTGLEGANLDSTFFDAMNVRYVLALKPLKNNLDYWLEQVGIPKKKVMDDNWFKAPFEVKLKMPRDVKYMNFEAQTSDEEKLFIEVSGNGQQLLLQKKDIAFNRTSNRLLIEKLAGQEVKLKFEGNALLNALHYGNGSDLYNKFKEVFYDDAVDPPVTIYENKTVMPRVNLYDDIIKSTGNHLEILSKLDIRKTALVETDKLLQKTDKKLEYRVSISDYKPQKVEISVDANKEALLVLGDTYYPGWRVFVDGQEQKVIKTNKMFRGVFIKPTSKKVVFSYSSPIYGGSFWISGLALLATLGLSVTSLRRKN